MANLTPKQEAFCREYVIDLNATQAAVRAGYSVATAQEQSSRLLTQSVIKSYVQSLMDERSKKTQITAEYVLNGIMETIERAKNEGDHNPTLKGLELLGKHLKLFTEKIEHSGKIELTNILQELDGRSKDLPEDQG